MTRAWLVCSIVCLLAPRSFAAEALSAGELLDKYRGALDSVQRCIIKSESHNIQDGVFPARFAGASGHKETHKLEELRYDGARMYLHAQRWGSALRTTTEANPSYTGYLYDGDRVVGASGRGKTGDMVTVQSPIQDPSGTVSWQMGGYSGGQLMGFGMNETARIDRTLAQSRKLSVRDRLESVGDSQCYVIEGVTKYGKYTIWIDPQHGYNVAKCVNERGEGDIGYERKPLKKGDRARTCMDNVRFEQMGGLWVPMESDLTHAGRFPSLSVSLDLKEHYKRTEVILNPDFETLKSFVPDDIEEGAKAYIGGGSVPYRWHDGKLVPDADYDAKGKQVRKHVGAK